MTKELADLYNNQAVDAYIKGDLPTALSLLKASLRVYANPTVQINYGTMLIAHSDYEEGIAQIHLGLGGEGVDPQFRSGAYCNLAIASRHLDLIEDGLDYCNHAIMLNPDNADAHLNRALLLLKKEEYEEGWAEFEWRFRSTEARNSKMFDFGYKRWHGEDLTGRNLFLRAEQGFGDTIQFCRYALFLAEQTKQVILEVPESLQSLLAHSLENVAVVTKNTSYYDYGSPLMSVAGTFETIPTFESYLKADPEKIAKWKAYLDERYPGVRIGLVWATQVGTLAGKRKSMSLSMLKPLLQSSATFISLQKDEAAKEAVGTSVVDLSDQLGDFMETAAVIMNLDLVISVDTAVGHLAGALGKPVWLFNRFDGCWRWLIGREDSIWYPSLRVFDQGVRGTWADAVERVRRRLEAWLTARA